jgi:hypothetical protein
VELLGVLTGEEGQPCYGVLVDADQAAGLADAATLLQVLEDREDFVLGEFAAVQRGAFAFGEALLASTTGQDTALLVGAIAEADPQVVATALAVVRAVEVEAAEFVQVVHGAPRGRSQEKKVADPLESE